MSKYKNKRVEYLNYSFASHGEYECFAHLKLLEKAGEISVDKVQDNVYLTKARIHYKPDFKCTHLKTNEPFWVEFKGFETPTWRIKRKLWLHYGPGPLEIYKKGNNGVKLTETLTPK